MRRGRSLADVPAAVTMSPKKSTTDLSGDARVLLGELRGVTSVLRRMEGILNGLQTEQRCMATTMQEVTSKLDDGAKTLPGVSLQHPSGEGELPFPLHHEGNKAPAEDQMMPMVSEAAQHPMPCQREGLQPSRLPLPPVRVSSLVDEPARNQQGGRSFIAPSLPTSWPAVLPLRCGLEITEGQKLPQGVVLRYQSQVCPNGHRGTGMATVRSTGSVQQRTVQQRRRSYIVIPGSALHCTLSLISFLVLLYDVMTIPVMLAWDIEPRGILIVAAWLSVSFWSIDLGFNFFTGFHRNGELQTSMSAIAKHYLVTWFLFDFVAIIGDWTSLLIQAVARASSSSVESQTGLKVLRVIKAGRLLRIVGVLRLIRILATLRQLLEKRISGFVRIAVKTSSLLFGTLLFLHILSCAWFAVGKSAPSDTGTHWTIMFEGGLPSSQTLLHYEDLYIYAVSIHWAAAQITLGATDVPSTNTAERVFTVFCMLVGLIFECTLVSSFSVAMVDFQISNKDRNHRLQKLREYLTDNFVTGTTCMLVQDQVMERMHERQREKATAEAVHPVLNLLPSRLYTQLRVEVFQVHLNSHPLLCLWGAMHMPTFERLCHDAVEFRFLQQDDELFEAGSVANEAYFVVSGELEYTQYEDTSAVTGETSTTASAGSWLCEAALWSEWIHVGTAMASTKCKLVSVNAEMVIEAMSRHQVMASVVRSYADSFHSKVIRAEPPSAEYPTDLSVPNTSFAEIAMDMHQDAQMAIGIFALNRIEAVGIRSYVAQALNMGPRELELLRNTIKSGESLVILNEGMEIELVVGLAEMHLLKEDGAILVQVGTQDPSNEHGASPKFQLPYVPRKKNMAPSDMLDQVLEAQLPLLAGKAEYLHSSHTITEGISRRFNVPVKSLCMACFAQLSSEFEAPICTRRCRTVARRSSNGSARRVSSASLKDLDEQINVLQKCVVYALQDQNECVNFYTWLHPDIFKALQHPACRDFVRDWVSGFLFFNEDADRVRVCPGEFRSSRRTTESMHLDAGPDRARVSV